MYNEGIRLILTSSSTSSKMVYVVPPGKCLLLTRLSFDSLFSFVPFNNKSPDYVYIKDSNRFNFNGVNKASQRKVFCENCLYCFISEKNWQIIKTFAWITRISKPLKFLMEVTLYNLIILIFFSIL